MSQNRANKLRMRRKAKQNQPPRPYSARQRRVATERMSQSAFGFGLPIEVIAPIAPLLRVLGSRRKP